MSQKERLTPPAPVYDYLHPRDPFIAKVTEIGPLEKPDPFAGCKNGSDKLERLIEIAEQSSLTHNFDFNRI